MQDMEQYIEDQARQELARRRGDYLSYLEDQIAGITDEYERAQAAKYQDRLLEEWESAQVEQIEEYKAQLRERLS